MNNRNNSVLENKNIVNKYLQFFICMFDKSVLDVTFLNYLKKYKIKNV